MAIQLYTAAQTRELDRLAIEDRGVPGYELMSRAGQVCYRALCEQWPEADRITVICGAGNNAGDGYVIARLALKARRTVDVRWLVDPASLKGDAARAWQDFAAAGGQAQRWSAAAIEADVVVDALLGTGLDRPLEGAFRDAVEAINAQPAPVLAVDIPTGLHADSGAIMGTAVAAHVTATFIGRKRGLYTGRGPACAGRIVFDDLGVPDDIYHEVATDTRLIGRDLIRQSLPARARDAHKGQHGSVVIFGGYRGMPGAARMAGESAMRAGAGLVKVAAHADHATLIPQGCPVLMAEGVRERSELAPLVAWSDVIAVGPGLGQADWSRMLLEVALASDRPLVVDADGLNLLAQSPSDRGNWILTPHPGEAARLLDCDIPEVESDRFAAAQEIAERYDAVCVLKGAGTVVADRRGLAVCALGNPGMASAGMGDVLTGVVAAMVGQGLPLMDAAEVAVCAHALAADQAAVDGERGLIATDVIDHLRAAVNPGGGARP